MKIKIPATSANLSAGFDALGLAISLYNEVIITKNTLQVISIEGEGSDKPHLKKYNTFVTIFLETYFNLTGKKDKFKFLFTNNIPLSRGLGSSSAVIVGAIASAYHMAGHKVIKETVLNKALVYEPHPDNITPATYGGFTSSIVHKEKVYTQKKELPSNIQSVIVIPDKPMSTKHSRTLLPKNYTKEEAICNLSHSAFLTAIFINEQWDLLRLGAVDAMHEKRRMKTFPILFKVQEISYANGALMSTLSGSGSTFFNLVYQKDATKLFEALKKEFKEFTIKIVDFDNRGFVIEDIPK